MLVHNHMAKSPMASMMREAAKHMSDMRPMMDNKRKAPAYGRGGKKGRYQYGKIRIKGYADPLA